MDDAMNDGVSILPARWQPELPVERFLLDEDPDPEAVPMDVLFVGGGPAGLAGAIELARLVRAEAEAGGGLGEVEIGVLEKSAQLGEHCLSGAVVEPGPLRSLFPELSVEELPLRAPVRNDRVYLLTERRQLRLPTPPTMRNHGHYVASVCEVVRWMGERAEELGVNVFTGFPAAALLLRNGTVVGVRTTPSGLNRDGQPGVSHVPPTDLTARVTVLAEGTRGPLTQSYVRRAQIGAAAPQIYALGVKELWRVPRAPDSVIHTLGWPLPRDAFGGSWMYPMAEDLVSLGLVVGLDYRQSDLDVHALLQRLKAHPLVSPILEGGDLEEWGAKTIPEGGFHALPERLHGDGVLIVGDAAGFVDVASLKGIHYAIQSGIFAARAIFQALKNGDTSSDQLSDYDRMVRESFVYSDLRRTRGMRAAFKKGFYRGGLMAACMQLTGGAFPSLRPARERDADVERRPSEGLGRRFGGNGTFGKADAVFRSGNATRDDIPSHLVVPPEVPAEYAEFYRHMCPAAVYDSENGRLAVHAANCVDCKATDVLGPRWTPREGGSGPAYKRM